VAFVALLRAEGYDGITFMEGPSYNPTDAKKKARVWITFSPEQVRYAHPLKAAPPPVVEDDDDDWDDEDFVGNPRRATTAERTDPALWEAVKREVTAGSKGGVRGEWSARKAQLAVALYKKRGGGYLGPKSPQNALAKWTREDWRTRSGKPSLVTGERYLPARAIEALTPAEYAATTRAKRAGLRRDEQFTRQPERIAQKTARYRKNPDPPDTAAFRRWFGASKVVDAEGKPLVVYHGTTAMFDVFDFHAGIGAPVPDAVYFTDSLDLATYVAGMGWRKPSIVIAAYLRIENPLVLDAKGKHAIEMTDEVLRKLRPRYRADAYDGVILLNVREFQQDALTTTYAVLDPTQVKSVDATSFSRTDPNFRHNPRRNPTPREAEAIRAIRANLTPDLLAGEYRACATSGPYNPVAGHCAVATEALYFMLGGKAAGYTPMNVRHEGVSHWYLRTPDGRYLDPTADQFDTPVDYASGRGRGFPTPRQGHAEPPPSKRAATLLQRLGERTR
jgi:hypothetical protein